MNTFKTCLFFFIGLLTNLAGNLLAATQDNSDVSIDFKVPAELSAITDNMVVANVTVGRPYYEIYWTVTCATDPDFFFGGACGATGAGAGTYTIKASTPSAEPVELNSGNIYTFRFQSCEFGWDSFQDVASFEVAGSGAAAEQFSDITIVSFDGTPGALGYQFKNNYTVTFSAPVYDVKAFAPMGMDGTQPFAVTKKDTEGLTWKIDCSSMSGLEGAFELHIQARDLATGLRLRGTYGLDNSFIYTISLGASNPDDSGQDPNLPNEEPEIAALFINGLTYLLSEITPLDLDCYPEGAIFTFTMADEEIKKVSYEIIDHTTGDILKSVADLEEGYNGQWTAEMPRTYNLMFGHLYYIHVVARDGISSFNSNVLHEYNFLLNGTNEHVSAYSNVTLVSIEPSTSQIITEESPVITITFSEAIASLSVKSVLGQMSSYEINPENITTADHIAWTVNVPSGLMDGGQLSLNFVATDYEGNRVTDPEYGVGLPETCYLNFSWTSTVSLPTPSLLENGATLESLQSLNFGYEGIGLNQDNNTATWDQIRIWKDGRTLDLNLTEEMFTTSGDASLGATLLTLTLPQPLTESGDYRVTVPAMAFILGHDQDNRFNGSCEFFFTIEATDGFQLHEGNNYLPIYTSVTARFKALEDCKVLIEAEDQYAVEYDGHSYNFGYLPTNSPSNVCEIDNVTAGSTITLFSGFVMNPLVRITTFTSGTIIPIEVTHVSPAEGTSDFWKNEGLLDVTFNKQVTLSRADLLFGELRQSIEILHVSSAISLDMGPVLNSLLTDGTLKPGDAFEVEIDGLCESANRSNLYDGTGVLKLHFVAPEPQYALLSTTVNGQTLSTSGLNDYTFLSYYAPQGEDGVFTLEFETEVGSIDGAILHMGNRDLDAQGKYYEGPVNVSVDGNKVIVDARGVLRTLNILFPAVVEEDIEAGENTDQGMGEYDHEHITLRVMNVIDKNGNTFRSQQAGNVGSYSFYMNYKELIETINLDGDNKMAGDDAVAGEEIRLWLGNSDVQFESIQVSYVAQIEEDVFEPRTVYQTVFTTEPDPYEGIIISFIMPQMPEVAIGQNIHVSLYNAVTADGMPHDLGIDFKAGDPETGIETLTTEQDTIGYGWTLSGHSVRREAMTSGLYIVNGKKICLSK